MFISMLDFERTRMFSTTRITLVVVGTWVLIVGTGGTAFPWVDPFRTETAVAPEPGVPWRSPSPLPALPDLGAPEPPDASQPLTLPELTDFALRNNPQTREAWFAAQVAAADVGIEGADWLPDISGVFNLTRSKQVSANGAEIPWQTRYGPSVSLSYVLFDFGARGSEVTAARYTRLAANLTHNRVLQNVMLAVEQAYYQLLGFDALVEANELSLRNSRTVLDAADRRRESGLATVVDIYRVQTQVAQAELTLTQSKGNREKAKGQLASAVGLPVDTALHVQTPMAPPQVRDITTSIAELLERARANRPDLIAADAQARAARASAAAAARSAFPSIDLTASSGSTSIKSTVTDERSSLNAYSLSLNLRVPLFSGFRNTYTVRRAQDQAEQATAARDVLRRQTELDVWQTYYDVRTAATAITSAEAQVKSAEQTADATLARYQEGYGSILDLITAQQDASTARVQRIQSYFDWFTAFAQFTHAVGGVTEALTPGEGAP
jgi:TolC family type I secretion outer membrane protein